MATIRLKPGETCVVVAQDPSLEIGGGPMPGGPPPTLPPPVDPGYGIDLGLGYLRPTHPIVLPPPVTPPTEPTEPVDPGYGIDEDIGYVRPSHPIVLPPIPEMPELKWELKTAWTPTTGWVVVAIPAEGTLVPTPSKRK
jgi:hypothetical protein